MDQVSVQVAPVSWPLSLNFRVIPLGPRFRIPDFSSLVKPYGGSVSPPYLAPNTPLRTVPTNGKYFFPVNDYVRQVDHIRGYWNPKRKLGVTMHFAEITALQYGEKRWIGIFFRKMIKSFFFPKFQTVRVNWYKCNDNDNIRTSLYKSFFLNNSTTGKLSAVAPLHAFALKIV